VTFVSAPRGRALVHALRVPVVISGLSLAAGVGLLAAGSLTGALLLAVSFLGVTSVLIGAAKPVVQVAIDPRGIFLGEALTPAGEPVRRMLLGPDIGAVVLFHAQDQHEPPRRGLAVVTRHDVHLQFVDSRHLTGERLKAGLTQFYPRVPLTTIPDIPSADPVAVRAAVLDALEGPTS
jgi:hypothetical protein